MRHTLRSGLNPDGRSILKGENLARRKVDLELEFMYFDSKYFHFGKKKLDTLLGVEWRDLDKHRPPLLGKIQRYRTANGPDKFKIFVNESLKKMPRIASGTLLHEMVHFKLYGKDSSRLPCGSRMFEQEMKKLALRGALKGLW